MNKKKEKKIIANDLSPDSYFRDDIGAVWRVIWADKKAPTVTPKTAVKAVLALPSKGSAMEGTEGYWGGIMVEPVQVQITESK